jgi:DNA-directed RNA polymerase specialized sigma24 family protein
MSPPSREEEWALHERVLQGMSVATTEVFEHFMPHLLAALCPEMGCTKEEATDCILDAVIDYLERPESYDRNQAPLRSYLTLASRRNVMDSRRSEKARTRREGKFADVVELQARPPNEEMEAAVESALALEKLKRSKMKASDVKLLGLILQGESSTLVLARPLGLDRLPADERKRKVKQNRDRVLKRLRRHGKEGSHDNP